MTISRKQQICLEETPYYHCISRWTKLYKPSPIVSRYLNGIKLSKAELAVVAEDIEKWRHRLYDVSWFMRNLNESIARQANKEDNCTGKFWEGRFKSQALLDDAALLTCMSYVDLNPIRSKIADRPEESDFTSIQDRIRHYQNAGNRAEAATTSPEHLLPFVGGEHQDKTTGLNFSLPDYLELTDWAGRAIKEDKSGAIPSELAPILERLNIDPEAWLDSVKNYGKNHNTVIGTREGIKQFTQTLGRKWFCSSRFSLQIYQTSPV